MLNLILDAWDWYFGYWMGSKCILLTCQSFIVFLVLAWAKWRGKCVKNADISAWLPKTPWMKNSTWWSTSWHGGNNNRDPLRTENLEKLSGIVFQRRIKVAISPTNPPQRGLLQGSHVFNVYRTSMAHKCWAIRSDAPQRLFCRDFTAFKQPTLSQFNCNFTYQYNLALLGTH